MKTSWQYGLLRASKTEKTLREGLSKSITSSAKQKQAGSLEMSCGVTRRKQKGEVVKPWQTLLSLP